MYLTALCLLLLPVVGCSVFSNQSKPLHLSEQYYNYLQPSFDQYLAETKDWLSAWGYQEEGKAYARLTWNPYFDNLDNEINKLVNSR